MACARFSRTAHSSRRWRPGSSGPTTSSDRVRTEAAGLTWATVEALDEQVLEAKLYGPKLPQTAQRPLPDWALVHAERLKPNVTLELLHLE